MYGYYSIRVFPFGYLRVSACLQLVVAFRSLPRPSSALSAKASTVCPYSLDLFVFCIPTADLHMQYCECIAYALSFLRFFSCKKLFFLLGRKLFYLTSISEKLSVIHCVVFKEPLPFRAGGDKRNRTVDPLLARQVLSQLSYTPTKAGDGTRTRDLLITNQLLCQLSYTGQYSRVFTLEHV